MPTKILVLPLEFLGFLRTPPRGSVFKSPQNILQTP